MEQLVEAVQWLSSKYIKYSSIRKRILNILYLKESNFTTYQRMWAAMEADMSVFTQTNAEGVERVLKGKRLYAYLMESTSLEYIVERNCSLMQIGGWLDYKTYGIAMPFSKMSYKSSYN